MTDVLNQAGGGSGSFSVDLKQKKKGGFLFSTPRACVTSADSHRGLEEIEAVCVFFSFHPAISELTVLLQQGSQVERHAAA